MTSAARRLDEAAPALTTFATTADQAAEAAVPGLVRRAAAVIGDLLGVLAIGLAIPVAILAIGIPIALGVRVLLWIGGRF
jgi:hypothetical protein